MLGSLYHRLHWLSLSCTSKAHTARTCREIADVITQILLEGPSAETQVPGFTIPGDPKQAEKKCSLLAAAFCRYAELGDWDKLAALLAGLQVGQPLQ